MNAVSRLRTRVTLEAPLDVVDETGALQRSWIVVASPWVELAPRKTSGEYVAAEEGEAILWDVALRWRADIAPPMRFRYGARILAIRAAVDPDARRRTIVCRCEEFSS